MPRKLTIMGIMYQENGGFAVTDALYSPKVHTYVKHWGSPSIMVHCLYGLCILIIIVLGCYWRILDFIVEDEGNPIGSQIESSTLVECQKICDDKVNEGCQSFGYCPDHLGGSCFLYDKNLIGTEPLTSRTDCYTNYRECGNNFNN